MPSHIYLFIKVSLKVDGRRSTLRKFVGPGVVGFTNANRPTVSREVSPWVREGPRVETLSPRPHRGVGPRPSLSRDVCSLEKYRIKQHLAVVC